METSTNLQTNEPIDLATKTKPTKPKMSGKKIALIVAGSIIAFIAIVVIVANMATNAPLKVSDELVADIQNNWATAAYQLMSSDAKATFTEKQFSDTISQIGPILNGKPSTISKETNVATGGASTAKVVYEIKGSDDNTYNFTVNLVEINGKWLVQNFESKVK